ncbi:46434_t:CDS:2, partial [Gigaspora margarita]
TTTTTSGSTGYITKRLKYSKMAGLSNQVFAVCLIRNVMETYDRIEYKIKEKIEICKEEEILVNGLDFEQKEKAEFEENKEVLIITKCGVPDYGTEEIKGKIMQAKGVELAKQDDLIERIIANIKQMEVHSKMEVDINIDTKTEEVDKPSNEFDKVEDISSSIWAQVSKSSQKNLKDRVEKAEIKEIETITGSDHSLVLLQLRSGSSFSRMKEYALEGKQTTRLIWNLNMASKKNWEKYKSSLWKRLYTQVPKFLCSQDAEEIKKGLSDRNEQIDKIWDIIEKAIIRSEKSLLPKKNKIRKTDHGVQSLLVEKWNQKLKIINRQAECNIKLDRKRNSLVESYREQNLREESETKRKRNQEVYKKAKRDDYKGTKDDIGKLLEKPLNKVKLDRVLVKKDLEYRLTVALFEVLVDTKDHFKGQFRERCPKIECMTEDWRAVYSPVDKVQENWVKLLADVLATRQTTTLFK